MAHEIVGELLAGGLEMAAEMGTSGDKKSGWGCFIMTLILIGLGIGFYYVATNQPEPIKGLVTKKLTEDRVLVKTQNGEDIHTITHELYLNKTVGDSIILNE